MSVQPSATGFCYAAAAIFVNYVLVLYTIRITHYFKRFDKGRFVVFTRAARESGHNDGFGPLLKKYFHAPDPQHELLTF
jgi:hypothetical protein